MFSQLWWLVIFDIAASAVNCPMVYYNRVNMLYYIISIVTGQAIMYYSSMHVYL